MTQIDASSIRNGASSAPIEKIPFYKPTGKEIDIFQYAYQEKLPLLLKGPTGTGKSRFVQHMAAQLERPLITVSCHEETSAIDLLGRYLIKGSETYWQDGPLTRAVRTGSIIYIDEIAEARPDTIVALHSLTDYRRELYLDRSGEHLTAQEGFMLVASFNPGYQGTWKELKPSTRQRFIGIHFDYPTSALEMEIVQAESQCDKRTAKTLVKLASKIRNLAHLGLAESISTRLLVDAGKLIRAGLETRIACEVAIVEPLTDDREIAVALIDLIHLHF